MPDKRIEELETKIAKIRKDLERLRPISKRRLVTDTHASDISEKDDFGYFTLTRLTSYLAEDIYTDMTEEPTNGRVRTKAGDVAVKCLGGLCAGAICLPLYPFAVIIDAPISALKYTFYAAEANANKNHNKRVKKAREKINKLSDELVSSLQELRQLKEAELTQ